MNTLRRNILVAAMGVAMSAPAVNADSGFQLSDKLSVTGFLDMSLVVTDPDGGSSSQSTGVDQFEIDFLFDVGEGLTAQVDVEYQDNGSVLPGTSTPVGEEVDVEQAFLAYQVSDELSVKAGRFLSYSGWETEEPTGLFQYSGTGYAKYFYGGYQQGVSAKYAAGSYDVALSLVNDLGDLEGEARDSEDLGAEAMLALYPTDEVTVKAFFLTDSLAGAADKTTTLINVWTSYSAGDLTLAAEINSSENAPAAVGAFGVDAEASGHLLMANYGMGKYGVTLRYHASEVENAAGATVEELSAITISPSYTVSENLLIVTELRMDDDDLTGASMNTLAVEALFTF